MEQAVFATFLHSQPVGQKAQTRELLTLLGHSRPDRIELTKALRPWTEVSWFLDEQAFQDAATGQIIDKGLPGYWRLGSRPNLMQMHHNACTRVSPEVIEEKLLEAIRNCNSLTADARAAGAHVHLLPEKPGDIEDEGNFHYVILGPKAASRPDNPSSEARRFLTEKSRPDAPRVYRNAVVLAVPLVEGVEAVCDSIRKYQVWLQVESQLNKQDIDNNRKQLLEIEKKSALARTTELVKQAYSIIVTVSDKNEIQAFKVVLRDNAPLFNVIKSDQKARILEGAVTAETLLPGGPYNLWHEGETTKDVNDLEKTFAQFYRLPKMLNSKAIVETLLDGCLKGLFVLRSTRSDQSYKTFWYNAPEIASVKDLHLEVVLSEEALLTTIPTRLLSPDGLWGLWNGPELLLKDLYSYFAGRTVSIKYDGYEEPFTIPRAERSVVNAAIQAAVKEKRLWLLSGQASLLAEDVPEDLLVDDAVLQTPLPPLAARDILPDNLPEVWNGPSEITALDIANALSTKTGKLLPWIVVSDAITTAFNARFVERVFGQWPCDYAGARMVRICQSKEQAPQPPEVPFTSRASAQASHIVHQPDPTYLSNKLVTEAKLTLDQIQDLNDQIPTLSKACVDLFGSEPTFSLRIEINAKSQPQVEHIEKINQMLREVSQELQVE